MALCLLLLFIHMTNHSASPLLTESPASMAIPDISDDGVLHSRPKYPSGVTGGKFCPNGTVQRFPGNTIISHLAHSSPLQYSLQELYAALAAHPTLSPLYTLLPQASWHMTIFGGADDKERKPGSWPTDSLPLDAPLANVTALYYSKLRQCDLLDQGPPYRLRVVGFKPLRGGIGVHVEPATEEENARLRRLRDRLADALEIKRSDHETFVFHISITYFIRWLDNEQKAELTKLLEDSLTTMPRDFELGSPEFCTFEDMFLYERSLYLGIHEYPIGVVEGKFSRDGEVLPYPGNTIIAPLPPSSPLRPFLQSLHDRLTTHPTLSHLYALLPASSWHMTIFNGVTDKSRVRGSWPTDVLPLDAELSDVNALFAEKLRHFDLRDQGPSYHMRVVHFGALEAGIALEVEPATHAENARIRALRDRLAETLGVKLPGTAHENYVFHIGVGYLLRWLDDDQKAELTEILSDAVLAMPLEYELGAAQFSTFENMFAFDKVLYLGEGEESAA